MPVFEYAQITSNTSYATYYSGICFRPLMAVSSKVVDESLMNMLSYSLKPYSGQIKDPRRPSSLFCAQMNHCSTSWNFDFIKLVILFILNDK